MVAGEGERQGGICTNEATGDGKVQDIVFGKEGNDFGEDWAALDLAFGVL